MKKLIPQSIKNVYHLFQAILANLWFGFPTRKLKVIGVTGTDGKTTTCQMMARIFEEAGKKVAMTSTINFRINGEEEKNLSHFTTLSAFAVQKFANRAVKAGCEYLILETSSHSLDQYRVWGVKYKTAVMTNVTREHLDYHKSMEIYRQTKSKLFQRSKVAIVNLDMENPEEFLRHTNEKKITFSLKNDQADISASNVYLDIDKSSFTINEQQFVLNLVGDFNIENALAAITVAVSENIDLATCAKALEKITGVPGRMEYVPNDRGLNIIVDFALTPDALGKLYSALVRIKKLNARIIAVFGSCGERDRGKRPIMGEVVSRYADFVILTDDEPYHENPMQIIKNIESGITNKTENENFWIIPDRRAAIAKALQIAQADDLIAITGMGAEESMIVGDQKIPWNDRQVILEELKNIKNA
jgi:UDP-N-acetylmuramoyl-L-alanyl-D-glutamate--2,6-diaminopimelate ligase